MPIRILHVFSRMDRGGAEMRTLELLRKIDPARFTFEFCATSGERGELDAEIAKLGGKVHHLALGLGFAPRFAALLREGRFDVVHSHLLHTSGWMLQLARKARVPVRVAHFRSTDSGRSNSVRRRAQRWLLSRLIDAHATHILAVSEAAMNACWRAGWQQDARCTVIYNGLDLAPFQAPLDTAMVRAEFGIAPDAPFYIHVGNLRPPKNHARLLEIFASIAAAQPQAWLLLAGKGGNDIEAALRATLAQRGLAERVIFAGERDDVPRLLRAADLMIFPSRWEGLPGAVLEASAAGVPVLASRLPVIAEIERYLPLLKSLSLEDGNEVWAAAAGAQNRAATLEARAGAARDFANGPFNVDTCLAAHARVWESG